MSANPCDFGRCDLSSCRDHDCCGDRNKLTDWIKLNSDSISISQDEGGEDDSG